MFKIHNNYLKKSQYVGQIKSTFLVFSSATGIILVDQHAAHEQILFENSIISYEKSKINNDFISTKKLCKIFTDNKTYIIIKNNIKLISELGFILNTQSKNQVSMKYCLSCYRGCSLAYFVKVFITEYNEAKHYGIIKYNFLRSYFQGKACKKSWKSGSLISRPYAINIKNKLNQLTNNSNCPHGRPIIYFVGFKGLNKHFFRKKCYYPFDI